MTRWGEDTYFSGISRLDETAENARIVIDPLDMDAASFVMNMAVRGDIDDVLRMRPERVDRLLRIVRLADMLGLEPVVAATRAMIVGAGYKDPAMDALMLNDLRTPDRGLILDSDEVVGGALVPRIVRACAGALTTTAEDVVALLRSDSSRLRRAAAVEVGNGFMSPFGVNLFGAGALKPLAGILLDVAEQQTETEQQPHQMMPWTEDDGAFVGEVLKGVLGVVRWACVPGEYPDRCDARDLEAGLKESGIYEALGNVLARAGSDVKTAEVVHKFLVDVRDLVSCPSPSTLYETVVVV